MRKDLLQLPVEILWAIVRTIHTIDQQSSLNFALTHSMFNQMYWTLRCQTDFNVAPQANSMELYLALVLLKRVKAKSTYQAISDRYARADRALHQRLKTNSQEGWVYYNLALLHLASQWQKKKHKMGRRYCHKALNQNILNAGILWDLHCRTRFRFKKLRGFQLIKKEAEKNNKHAIVLLSNIYRVDYANKIEPDATLSLYWFNKLHELGDYRWTLVVAMFLEYGDAPFKKDINLALHYYKLAADHGDERAVAKIRKLTSRK